VTTLLDSSVVIGLLRHEHMSRPGAEAWFGELAGGFATCPITQGAFVRLALQRDESTADAIASLVSLTSDERHEFWPDDLAYEQVRMAGVIGHRQVTDAYLAELARRRDGRVATLDKAFAALHPDVAELVPA
jgi:toxin-antitoxin system PIN domain toxin